MTKSVHIEILKIGTLLGYFSPYAIGACVGITMRWLEASFLNEEELFNQRLNRILNDGFILEEIELVKEKVKHHKDLTEIDKKYLDLLAFYESTLLFQYHDQYVTNLLGHRTHQSDFEQISTIASSQKIEDLGGLVKAYSELGIYTAEEIEENLSQFTQIIDDLDDSIDPIGFYLASDVHAIGLTYYRAKNQWGFKDSNSKTSMLNQERLTTQEVSEKIFGAFKKRNPSKSDLELLLNDQEHDFNSMGYSDQKIIKFSMDLEKEKVNLSYQIGSGQWTLNKVSLTKKEVINGIYNIFHRNTDQSPYVTFGTSVIMPRKNEEILQLKSKLTTNKRPQVITQEIAQRKNAANLACVAAFMGDSYTIGELIRYQVNLNDAKTFTGDTPAHIAARHNDVEILQKLAEDKIHPFNFDSPSTDDETPLHEAAKYGSINVIKELAKHTINWNAINKDGETALYIAVGSGSIIAGGKSRPFYQKVKI